MRATHLIASSLLLTLAALPATASEGTTLDVEDAAIARGVEEREPVDAGTDFPADVGELFCFTRITGGSGDAETSVVHVWRRGEEEVARVRLPVRGASWRTWSRKRVLPSWTGEWTVDVEDTAGNVLETLSFTIGTPQ
ncbi:MAG: DUF2914 domain-containing protein [Acidobacteriota bacterium]|jgi:hypothetical protein